MSQTKPTMVIKLTVPLLCFIGSIIFLILEPGLEPILSLLVSIAAIFEVVKVRKRILDILFSFLTLIIFIAGISYVRSGGTVEKPSEEKKMVVTRLTGNTVEVSWENLPTDQYLYVFTCADTRCFYKEPIIKSSGKEEISPGNGIDTVAIIQANEPINPNEFPTNGYEIGDKDFMFDILLREKIPE